MDLKNRFRWRRATMVLVTSLVGAWTMPQSHATDKHDRNGGKSLKKLQVVQAEEAILTYTNNERLRVGLPVLSLSPALSFIARGHTRNMCSNNRFQHESDEFPAGWRRFGERLEAAGVGSGSENIAFRSIVGNHDAWAEAVLKGWMRSPRHKNNILNPGYRYLGVGVEACKNEMGYATQVFSSEPGRISGHD
jgi:uncharacterized protein YkwD